jgi:hypothetical protein
MEVCLVLLRQSGGRCAVSRDEGKLGALSADESGKIQPQDCHLTIHYWSLYNTTDIVFLCKCVSWV